MMLAWLLLMSPHGASGEVIWNYHTWLSRGVAEGFEKSADRRFGCDDLIYLFVRSENEALDGAKLRTEWTNQSSGIRHQTERAFQPTDDGKGYWSWGGIEFTAGSGGPLERLTGFLDPVAGRENVIGQWRISIRIDGLYRHETDMLVLC